MLVTILVFIVILSVLVLIHEAGHFFVAKKLGVKVEEFGFGFPPRVASKKFGETVYSLNLLPIGGFVKLYGEDDAGAGKINLQKNKKTDNKKGDLKRAFFTRPVWQRALIVVAGVVMNFFLALVLISYLLTVQGIAIPGNKVYVAEVSHRSPAETAGLKSGDIIRQIDGINITSPAQMQSVTKAHLGEQIVLQIVRRKTIFTAFLTPRRNPPAGQGSMGVRITVDVSVKKYPWYQSPFVGIVELFKESGMILVGLGTLVSQVAVQHTVPKDLAGPVGIAQLTGQFVQVGFNAVLSLVALLSINLAVLNVLPIPALDGGRLFFILVEGVTGKKVNQTFEGYAHTAGMIALLALIVFITFHDIVRLVQGQPLIPSP